MTSNRFAAIILPPTPVAFPRVGTTALGRFQDDSDNDLPVFDKRNHHRKLAVLASEPTCAIDGIDDPQSRPGARHSFQCRCLLLRAEGIAGEQPFEMA